MNLYQAMSPTQRQNIDQYRHHGGLYGLISLTALRTLQFILAITIAGLYGVDLKNSTKSDASANSEWIYAEVAACLSAITCVIHCFATVTHAGWYTWDFVLFILWMAQTGVFGNIYLSSDVREGYKKATSSMDRMKAGIWISLVCMVLWLGTFVLGIAWCIRARKVLRKADQAGANKAEAEGNVKDTHDEERAYRALDDSGSETEIGDEIDCDSISKKTKGVKDPFMC